MAVTTEATTMRMVARVVMLAVSKLRLLIHMKAATQASASNSAVGTMPLRSDKAASVKALSPGTLPVISNWLPGTSASMVCRSCRA